MKKFYNYFVTSKKLVLGVFICMCLFLFLIGGGHLSHLLRGFDPFKTDLVELFSGIFFLPLISILTMGNFRVS